jgi:hypothetical protein
VARALPRAAVGELSAFGAISDRPALAAANVGHLLVTSLALSHYVTLKDGADCREPLDRADSGGPNVLCLGL